MEQVMRTSNNTQQIDIFKEWEVAQKCLKDQIKSNASSLATVLRNVSEDTIENHILDSKKLHFYIFSDDPSLLCLQNMEGQESYFVNPHALRQACGRLHYYMQDVNYLLEQGSWGRTLVEENLNKRLWNTTHKDPDGKFLIRTVKGQALGFLSRHYALHLSTDPLLHRFVDYCREYDAHPVSVTKSDVRISFQCVSSHLYQPLPGFFMALGMTFQNSDFGAGTFLVTPTLFSPRHGFSVIFPLVYDLEAMKKVHRGPLLTQLDSTVQTQIRKRTDEVAKLMQHSIQKQLSSEWGEMLCNIVRKAHATTKTWPQLRSILVADLVKEELEALEVLLKTRHAMLPDIRVDSDGLPIPTMWWATLAVSTIEKTTVDADRKIELQQLAGKLVMKGK